MNLLKSTFLLVCVTMHYNLHTMEKTISLSPNGQLLFQAIAARKIEVMERILSCTVFNFASLAYIYAYVLGRAKKLTPNEKMRSDSFMQEAIEKTRLQREIALDKLNNLDIIQSSKGITYATKTRKEQIDETLIDQGKLFLTYAQIIYPYLKPLITEGNNANILFLFIGKLGYLDLLQDFITTYEPYIDWNYCDAFGRTILHINARTDNLAMIQYLLSKNIDCNQRSYFEGNKEYPHETALHYAARNHHAAIVRYLLANESDPNIPDHFGNLPLHCVSPGSNGDMEIFEMLLAAGTNIDNTSNGKTALYKAVLRNNPYAVDYLLKLGADPDANQIAESTTDTNTSDWLTTPLESLDWLTTPLSLAEIQANLFDKEEEQKNNTKIIKMLKKYRKNSEPKNP